MPFSTVALKEMIIKSTIFLILIHLMIIKVTHGYLGCPDKLVPCSNKTHCIQLDEMCVNYHDCIDELGHPICNYCNTRKNDSIACVTHIEPHLIHECLSHNQICDDIHDCVNGQDEHLCHIQKCKHDFWLCKSGTCIEKHRLCDKNKDCPDGSDEGDFCYGSLCESNAIRCPTGECILKAKMCDGVSHCSDGYDEENCPHLTATTIKDSCSIPSNTFSCSTCMNSICISNDRICDGFKDCPLGDDEYDCNNTCTSKSFCTENSDVTCIQHPAVDRLCRCTKSGYRLITDSSQKNTQTCQDFNECNDSLGTYCSFNCINTDGNFNCTCPLNFILDKETKACRRINDQSKPIFLILYDTNIILYNILNNTDHYSLKPFKRLFIGNTHNFDHIQYDSYQMFLIYYDQNERNILCKSSITLKTQILVSNITLHGLAYNANDKTLFIIENQSQTLRMYAPITCEIFQQIKMHSWSFNNISNSIQSMKIDIYERQFIFATRYQFLVSNMSEPNLTKVVYSTDREIKKFIYDTSFKRIFWTTINKTNKGIFPVYSCDNMFKQCYDTSMILPSSWPFGFFNDGLIYTSLSLKSLDFVQLYGRDRFLNSFITSTKQNIRSFLFLDYQQTDLVNLCMKNSSITRCKNELCLQINSTEINCLSIEENLMSKEIVGSEKMNSDLEDGLHTFMGDDNESQIANQRKGHHFRLSKTMVFCIIFLGVLVTILVFFVKRCHKRINRNALDNEGRQNEQCFTGDEPNLDEFSVMVNDTVSKQRVDYACEILLDNPNILLNHDRLPLTDHLHY